MRPSSRTCPIWPLVGAACQQCRGKPDTPFFNVRAFISSRICRAIWFPIYIGEHFRFGGEVQPLVGHTTFRCVDAAYFITLQAATAMPAGCYSTFGSFCWGISMNVNIPQDSCERRYTKHCHKGQDILAFVGSLAKEFLPERARMVTQRCVTDARLYT